MKPNFSDRIGSFTTVSQIHVVNNKSVEALRDIIKEKYKTESISMSSASDDCYLEENVNSEVCLFRPNIVINESEPWIEEEYQEFRYKNVLFRQIGPCFRCKRVLLQAGKNNLN